MNEEKDYQFDDNRSREVSKLKSMRPYKVLEKHYSLNGISNLIDQLLNELPEHDRHRTSLGRLRYRMTEFGDDPMTYLIFVENAQKRIEEIRSKKSPNGLENK